MKFTLDFRILPSVTGRDKMLIGWQSILNPARPISDRTSIGWSHNHELIECNDIQSFLGTGKRSAGKKK